MVSRNGLAWLECRQLRRLRWVLHAFSTRRKGVIRRSRDPSPDGSTDSCAGGLTNLASAGLNLGFTEGDRRQRVEQNRRQFFAQLGAQDFVLASLRQIHSSHVYQVTRRAGEKPEYRPSGVPSSLLSAGALPAGDALLTDQSGILLSVRGADCLLLVLADPEQRAVAAVHAGWRGALERVVEKVVGEMRRSFSSRPEQLLAALGPSIRACCYEVGEEVVDAFQGRFQRADLFFPKVPGPPGAGSAADLSFKPAAFQRGEDYVPAFLEAQPARQRTSKSAHLDLVAVARAQLQEAGVNARRVAVAEFCTACRSDLFYSHRKEGPRTGRVMAVIGIRG